MFPINRNLLLTLSFLLLISRSSSSSLQLQDKAEATVPATPLSPPEGNTTFLGGTSWCVARPGAAPTDLQIALDWACGTGKADCSPIQAGGTCFHPNTLLSHASFAFNSYYQQNGNSDIACYFGGAAALTRNDPSFARCSFSASEPLKASAAAGWRKGEVVAAARHWWWQSSGIILLLLLLYL